MSAVGWAIMLALPVWALVQLLALLALGRRFELDDPPRRTAWHLAAGGQADRPDAAGPVCPACGAENGRAFTYCRNCVARLSAR